MPAMAETHQSAQTAHEPHAEREMTIDLRPYGWARWEFEGTRAQLEAEGVIPPATHWPADARWVEWIAGPLKFHLRRTRPPGLKGPMRLWVNGDWWCLHCDQVNAPDHLQQRVIDARRKLQEEAYRASPAGQRAWSEEYRRRREADRDRAFQAFKASVPGLIPPRRGRRAGGAAG